jgi:TolB protein
VISPETSAPETPRQRPHRRRSSWSIRFTPAGLLLVLLFNLVILGVLAWPLVQIRLGGKSPAWLAPVFTRQALVFPTVSPTHSTTPSLTLSPTSIPPSATLIPEVTQVTPTPPAFLNQGLMILSLTEGDHAHLFAYQPEISPESMGLPLTRLMDGPWDDIQPAFSPDGKMLAFVSDRNGYWDIYLLEFSTGLVSRLTDSPEFDGYPTWSPDGLWIAYESYVDENLDIFIRPVDQSQAPIRLTSHPAADTSPAWSPDGREIVFISTRSGSPDVWVADLDQAEESLFMNVSRSPAGEELHPAWSPDGTSLAWASVEDGFHKVYQWSIAEPEKSPRIIGSGDWPVWSPAGDTLLTALFDPNRNYLTAYPLANPGLVLPPMDLPGFVMGLDWGMVSDPLPLDKSYREAAQLTPTPLYVPALTPASDLPPGRYGVVLLDGVQAPVPYLHDMVDEAFQGLRSQATTRLGWDFLSTLDNAYVPLTTPLDPGMAGDWLYTGRAFQVVTMPLSAGWMAVVREDFGDQTYWRVFVRVRFQDGSAGMPLGALPWDFTSRFSGDTDAYERGGGPQATIPTGYWLDFTQLAAAYGWERLPALPIWRASYPAARFSEFVLNNGLDWRSAMLELYPPEALLVPTAIVPPTRTLTPTPRWYQSPTPTFTATFRPTFTPVPPTIPATPTQTRTPVPSLTRRPVLTTTPSPSVTINPAEGAMTTTPTVTP